MMTEQQAKQLLRNRLMLVAVVLVFLVPLLLAWYVAQNPARGGGEHGILIKPPRELKDRELVDPVTGQKSPLHGKWTMFALIEGECEQGCVEVLYRMRQIRLSMGRRALRVQRTVYFTDAGVEKNAKNLFSGYEGQLLLPGSKAEAEFSKYFLREGTNTENAIYLIDPRGFLMMCYPRDAKPSGMIKDLMHLLKTTG
ncbi:MAG: hypothetical protein ACRESK_09635 [Gammaproteobacteria bacterium]